MTHPRIPQGVLDAAHARRAARIAEDWAEADRLRIEIEAAGWRVTDRGRDFALTPAHPPDIPEGGVIRYGSSAGVPSLLEEPSTVPASVIVRVADGDRDAGPQLRSLRACLPRTVQVVVVADDLSPATTSVVADLGALTDREAEVVWTSAPLGAAACLHAGLRRSRGDIVVVLGPGTELRGDVLPAVASALAEPRVAVVGANGLAGSDVRNLASAPPGAVVALDGRLLACRRALAAVRGPIDERLATWPLLATWWTLALRDEGPGQHPLRAVALSDLAIGSARAARGGDTGPDGPDAEVPGAGGRVRDRLVRRDRYRLLDRFGGRADLFAPPSSD